MFSPLPSSKRLCADSALRENWLDWFRLGLAMLVIISHCFPLATGSYEAEPLAWLSHGQKTLGGLAVDFFFVISGFLIVRSWLYSRSMQDYFRKRILRIYPGYIAGMLFSIGLALAASESILAGLRAIPLAGFLKSFPMLEYWVLTLPALAFTGNPETTVNGSLWTIRLEFGAYIGVAVFGLFGLYRFRRLSLAVAVLVYAIYGWKVLHSGPVLDHHWRLGCFFVAGMAMYLFRDVVPRSRALLGLAVAALAVATFFRPWLHLVLPLAGTYVLFYCAFLPVPPRAAGGARPDLSYGTYLYAFPVQQFLVHTLHLRSPAALLALTVPVTLLLAVASWHFVEKPFLKMKGDDFPDQDPTLDRAAPPEREPVVASRPAATGPMERFEAS